MLNCTNCPWANPDTCRSCRAEQAAAHGDSAGKLEALAERRRRAQGLLDELLAGQRRNTGAEPLADTIGMSIDRVEWTGHDFAHQN